MALAGELQSEKGNRVTANDTVAMLLNDYLAKEIEAKELESSKSRRRKSCCSTFRPAPTSVNTLGVLT